MHHHLARHEMRTLVSCTILYINRVIETLGRGAVGNACIAEDDVEGACDGDVGTCGRELSDAELLGGIDAVVDEEKVFGGWAVFAEVTIAVAVFDCEDDGILVFSHIVGRNCHRQNGRNRILEINVIFLACRNRQNDQAKKHCAIF